MIWKESGNKWGKAVWLEFFLKKFWKTKSHLSRSTSHKPVRKQRNQNKSYDFKAHIGSSQLLITHCILHHWHLYQSQIQAQVAKKTFSVRHVSEPRHAKSIRDWQMFSLCSLPEKVQKSTMLFSLTGETVPFLFHVFEFHKWLDWHYDDVN